MAAYDLSKNNQSENLIGNEGKRISDTDFLPIALGIALGVIVGKISLSFSNSFTFSFGLTGGVLLTALVLSAVGKTGPVIWTMSGSANQLLRQLGLLLFLANVGTAAVGDWSLRLWTAAGRSLSADFLLRCCRWWWLRW